MTLLQTLTGVSVLGYANQLVEIEAVALAGHQGPARRDQSGLQTKQRSVDGMTSAVGVRMPRALARDVLPVTDPPNRREE
jgi:hypothetical protein